MDRRSKRAGSASTRGRLCSAAAIRDRRSSAAVELVRKILSQPDGADQLADLTEVICLGQTMREFEKQTMKIAEG
jgi:hypothetical protein